ncbi:MAG: hypothetical protein H5U19_11140 [Rhodobacteraceae bacterium]|nr:hypothetical protein [Paracoccaceae bacterium]
MPFSTEHHAWLVKVQQRSTEFQNMGGRMEKRGALLVEISSKVTDLQDELMAAGDDLTVEWKRAKFLGLIERSNRTKDWQTGDRDKDVDTVGDLTGDYQVDPDAEARLRKLHEELVALQTQMETAVDPDDLDDKGNPKPLFDTRDITRELWTPLVQADVIPSNAVANKYSQEAQVFEGACKVYQERLEDHTRNSSKHENAKRAIRIGMDVTALCGTIAAESIKLGNLDSLAISRHDRLNYDEAKAAANPTAEQTDFIAKIDGQRAQGRMVALATTSITMATTVIQGGFGIFDTALDRPDKKKGWNIAEATFKAIGDVVLQGIAINSAAVAVNNVDKAFSSEFKTEMSAAANLAQYALKGGQAVFRIHDIIEAPNKEARKKAALALIGVVAGAVGNGFAAFDTKRGTDENGDMLLGSQGQWQQIGATVQGAIVGAADAAAVADHIYSVYRSGGKIDSKTLIAALGITAMVPSFAGAMPKILGEVYSVPESGQIDAGAKGLFQQTQKEADIFNDNADAVSDIVGKGGSVDDFLARTRAKPIDPAAEAAMARMVAEQEAARKEAARREFEQELADPVKRQEFFAAIEDASDREVEKLNELLDAAQTRPEDLVDVEKERRAMAAMDKLIAEAQSCNAKWQALDMFTSVGAQVLAAALPAAGMAVAAQKLLIDTTTLLRKSIQLNKWMDNMELTVASSSVYGPAIKGRLHSARVQVSLQSLRVFYDLLGVTAEAIKIADASGVSMGGGLAAGLGIQAGTTMARALTEFGYKMEKETEIEAGWHLFKSALASPGDRKKARKAMKWNSTLSKCVLAYGIVIDGDPIAKEVARSCGMTPEVLADQKNVCQKVVTYFETLYSDDPVVMKRVPLRKDWHPGIPSLTLTSWLRFKAEAKAKAMPNLADDSLNTPEIDRLLATLCARLGPDADYAAKRDADFPEFDPSATLDQSSPEYGAFLMEIDSVVMALIAALRAYRPVTGTPPPDTEKPWTPGMQHGDFVDVVESLTAQAQLIKGEIASDMAKREAAHKQREATMAALADIADDPGAVPDDMADKDLETV